MAKDDTKNDNAKNKDEPVIERASEVLGIPESEGELKERLEMCKKEKDEYLLGWRRTKADYTNFKNEEMQRLENVVKYGNEEIIKDLITVLESFELGMQSITDPKTKEGVERIKAQFDDILKRSGLQKIEIKEGEKFDPKYHEVLLQEESDKPADTILEELGSGYLLHGKVIKPTKVKIAK